MTIRKGEPWGELVDLPDGLQIAGSDAEARALVESGVRELRLTGGDLARTMGRSEHTAATAGKAVRAAVDLLRVECGGQHTLAVAHVVARRGWWRGPVVLAMNAEFLGAYDVAPRSHPNDGRVDIVEVSSGMAVRTRLQARRRAATGSHLPHPDLRVSSSKDRELVLPAHTRVFCDGVRWATGSRLRVTVEPDALTVYV